MDNGKSYAAVGLTGSMTVAFVGAGMDVAAAAALATAITMVIIEFFEPETG